MPHEPCVTVAKLKLTLAGSVSVISTVCAVSGPVLVIVTV